MREQADAILRGQIRHSLAHSFSRSLLEITWKIISMKFMKIESLEKTKKESKENFIVQLNWLILF